jgi:HSP20 family protein
MLRDLAPWTRERDLIPRGDAIDPVLTLNREMNRLFDRLARGGYDLAYPAYAYGPQMRPVWPMVAIDETETGFKVSAELPGVDEKDVEVLLDDEGTLIIRGEKHADHEGAGAFSERMYGRFERKIALGAAVEAARCGDGCQATFKDGVLTVFLPKAAEESQYRRIPVNGATSEAAAAPS